ncbi:MAG: immunoglobulin domain-containing protein [Verrucomicrobiales bacterium]|nr:immunoglobulin domain-containing protein [Verrucomicrobiales bacterium]
MSSVLRSLTFSLMVFKALLISGNAWGETRVPLEHAWNYTILTWPHSSDWASPSYDDTKWLKREAVIVRSPLAIGRSLALRTTFVFDGEPRQVALKLSHFIGGGAVFYLNGLEVGRFNLSNDAPLPGWTACEVGPTNVVLNFLVVDSGALRAGTNVLAAEVFPRLAEKVERSYILPAIFGLSLDDVPIGSVRIDSQPRGSSVLSGQSVTLESVASGEGSLNFQWEKDGVPLEGRRTPQLQIASASLQDAGIYRVRVWNESSELWSNPVGLNVIPSGQAGAIDPSWFTTFAPLASDSIATIAQVYRQKDGGMLVAGSFSQVQCTPGFSGVARLRVDGTPDPSFQAPQLTELTSANAFKVHAVRELMNGKIIVGGIFGRVNGDSRMLVAWLNPDGTLDSSRFLRDSRGPLLFVTPKRVEAIVELENGQLLIGGEFGVYSGARLYASLIRVNEDGTLDEGFRPPLPADCGARAIQVLPSGKYLIGGRYIGYWDADRTAYSGDLLRLEADGTLDSTFPKFPGMNEVNCIVPAPDGSIYVGALRTTSGCNNLLHLPVDGEPDPFFGGELCRQFAVHSLAVQSNGALIVNGTHRFRPDGVKDKTFGGQPPQGDGNPHARQLICLSDDRVLAVGNFLNWDDQYTGPSVVLQAPFYPPELRVEIVRPGVLRVLWPEWAKGYELQSAERMNEAEGSWSAVSTAEAELVAGHWRLSIKASDSTAFYRLKRN